MTEKVFPELSVSNSKKEDRNTIHDYQLMFEKFLLPRVDFPIINGRRVTPPPRHAHSAMVTEGAASTEQGAIDPVENLLDMDNGR